MNEHDIATGRTFTSWLFRAYLDLGPVPVEAPHHLHGLDFGIRALLEKRPYPRIQSALNPSFRTMLVNETGLHEYAVGDPLSLPESLRTDRWEALCEHVRAFAGLAPATQVRVAWLLGKLCLQDFLLALTTDDIARDDDHASLAYLRAYSRCRLHIDDARRPYSIDEFREIALHAPPGIARIDAHYQMVSQHVKNRGDLDGAEYWHEQHLRAIEESRSAIDETQYTLVMSRYYRVGGFLPQMRRDVERMIREMDLAEEYAEALPRRNEVERIAADEMLYPVYESRTKEALWLDDVDLAAERALKAAALSPYDVRAWLHVGQVYCAMDDPARALEAYQRAVRLAPPGREVASFMAGQCHEMLGDPESACDAYLASLECDPLGISAAESLAEVAGRLGHAAIQRWARSRVEDLRQREKLAVAAEPEPYKHFPKPQAAGAATGAS
jgi:tetratricopeptide (TPR) repeat protein